MHCWLALQANKNIWKVGGVKVVAGYWPNAAFCTLAKRHKDKFQCKNTVVVKWNVRGRLRHTNSEVNCVRECKCVISCLSKCACASAWNEFQINFTFLLITSPVQNLPQQSDCVALYEICFKWSWFSLCLFSLFLSSLWGFLFIHAHKYIHWHIY